MRHPNISLGCGKSCGSDDMGDTDISSPHDLNPYRDLDHEGNDPIISHNTVIPDGIVWTLYFQLFN